MPTKLTLSIDEEVIKKAKQLSRRKGKSISKIVEDYLKNISGKEADETISVKSLSGILKDKIPADVDLKKEKGEYLKNKYGV